MNRSSKQIGNANFWHLVFPACLLVAIICIDHWLVDGFSIVPMAAVLSLFTFSFLMEPAWVVRWCLVYLAVIFITLWDLTGNWSASGQNAAAMMSTRAISATAVGCMAFILSRLRKREKITAFEIQRLIDSLGVPTITSDDNGWITHTNPAARDLFPSQDLLGSPFFSLFSAAVDKGHSIQKYLDLSTGTIIGPIEINLVSSRDRSVVLPATLARLNTGARMNILTMIYPIKNEANGSEVQEA